MAGLKHPPHTTPTPGQAEMPAQDCGPGGGGHVSWSEQTWPQPHIRDLQPAPPSAKFMWVPHSGKQFPQASSANPCK